MNFLSAIFGILGTLLALFGGSNTSRTVYGPRVTDFRATSSKYGIAIPFAKGTVRQGGNCIWASDVVEHEVKNTECTTSGGLFGFGGTKTCTTTITYEYIQSFAIAFSTGVAAAYLRIFADGQVIADFRSDNLGPTGGLLIQNNDKLGIQPTITFYYGDSNNVQDPTIAANDGIDNTPAYNNIAYAVFSNFQLSNFQNRIPVITAEISYATAQGSSDNIIELIGAVPTETQVYSGQNYIAIQDSTSYIIIDTFGKVILSGSSYISATSLALPYVDRSDKIYSSYKYSGTASALVQYDLISGEVLYAYDLGEGSEPPIALDFDYNNNYIYAISDSGTYRLPLVPTYTDPVILDTTDIEKLVENSTTIGTNASDILFDGDANIWGLRYDTASNKKTYLIKYSPLNSYVGEVIGPLTNSTYTSPIDSSTTLPQGEYLSIDITNVYIGSNAYDYIASINKSTQSSQYILETTVSANDRTPFRGSKYQRYLYLESGVEVQLSNLTITTTYDLDTAFTGLSYGTITNAYYIYSLGAYLLYDSTSVYYGYIRSAASGDTLENIVNSIILDSQNEFGPLLVSTDLDFSNLIDTIVDGYIIDAQKQLTTILEPLAKIFLFDIIEEDGKFKAVERGTEVSQATISEGELTSGNTGNIPVIIISKLLDAELPLEVSVTYYQRSLDYQQATQRARKLTKKSTDKQDIATDLVITETRARQAAEIVLKDAWEAKEQYQFTLPRKYSWFSPGDVFTFILEDSSILYIRITTITYGANMALECSGNNFDEAIYFLP